MRSALGKYSSNFAWLMPSPARPRKQASSIRAGMSVSPKDLLVNWAKAVSCCLSLPSAVSSTIDRQRDGTDQGSGGGNRRVAGLIGEVGARGQTTRRSRCAALCCLAIGLPRTHLSGACAGRTNFDASLLAPNARENAMLLNADERHHSASSRLAPSARGSLLAVRRTCSAKG